MGKTFEPEFSKQDYQIIEEKTAYAGYCEVKQYTLQYKLFNGGVSHPVHRELICRKAVAAVLLYDPKKDLVLLIEQFRSGAMADPVGPWILEIVAGVIDEGETAESTAKREVLEESGCDCDTLIPICEYLVSPGISNEKTTIFCGIISAKDTHPICGLQDHGEDIKVHAMQALDAFALVKSGKITSASAVIALQWLELNPHRQQWE